MYKIRITSILLSYLNVITRYSVSMWLKIDLSSISPIAPRK